jgi:hypothetical protein
MTSLNPFYSYISDEFKDDVKQKVIQKLQQIIKVVEESIVYLNDNLTSIPTLGYLFSKTTIHCCNIQFSKTSTISSNNHLIKGNILHSNNYSESVKIKYIDDLHNNKKEPTIYKFISNNCQYNMQGLIPYRFGTVNSITSKIWFNNKNQNELLLKIQNDTTITVYSIRIKENIYEFNDLMTEIRNALEKFNISVYDEELETILDSDVPFSILPTSLSIMLGIVTVNDLSPENNNISIKKSYKLKIPNLYLSLIPLDKNGNPLPKGLNYQFNVDNKHSPLDYIIKIPINKHLFSITNNDLEVYFINQPSIYSINVKIHHEDLTQANVLYSIFVSLISENNTALNDIRSHLFQEHDIEINYKTILKMGYESNCCPDCNSSCIIL